MEGIRAYLAEHNPAASARVLAAIRSGFEMLRQLPFAGRPGRVPGSREWSGIRYPYVIVDYATKKTRLVEIAGVFHTAQGERKL